MTAVAVLLAAVACKSPEDKELQAGRRAFGRGAYREAIRHYGEVILQAPDSPQAATALYDQAVVYYLKLRDVDSAQANLRKLLTEHADSDIAPKARRMLAEVYEHELGDASKAVVEYGRLLDQVDDPQTRIALLMSIADCYYALDELGPAAEYYRRVIRDYPYGKDCDPAFIRLAHIEALAGRAEQALRILEELLEKTDDPESRRRALLSEAEIYMLSRRFRDARLSLARADREFPAEEAIHELAQRLDWQEREGKSFDDGSIESQLILQELQKHISWGRARRHRGAKR